MPRGQNLLNDIELPGSSWSSFGNEQIAPVLLDEMTAVHGVAIRLAFTSRASRAGSQDPPNGEPGCHRVGRVRDMSRFCRTHNSVHVPADVIAMRRPLGWMLISPNWSSGTVNL